MGRAQRREVVNPAAVGLGHHDDVVDFVHRAHEVFDRDGIFGGMAGAALLIGAVGLLVESLGHIEHRAGLGDFRGVMGNQAFHLLDHERSPAEFPIGAVELEAGAKGLGAGVGRRG